MALALNFHPSKDHGLSAEAKTFDGDKGFVTFTIRSGGDDVTFFLKDNNDAMAILNAASQLVAQVFELNDAKREEAANSVTL